MPKFLTYEEWLKYYEIEEEIEPCTECYGTGIHECDCGDRHDCCECNGSGKGRNLTRGEYELILSKQQAALIKWNELAGIFINAKA